MASISSSIRAIALVLGPVAVFLVAPRARAALQIYETRYYVIHTDLSEEDARETIIRMTRMFEEYRYRTAGFSGEINWRFPFYLYRNKQNYLAAGGPPGSGGAFTGDKLMAFAGGRVTGHTWAVVQHEGFHQFANGVIRGDLPTWLNEGLAEYFGEAVFTGDSFVSGLIPPNRLARLRGEIKNHRLKSIQGLMQIGHAEWNRKISIENYDQAWSIVHFLVHAQDPKFTTNEFVQFITDLGRGERWQTAWHQTFGDAGGFEQHWRDWWLSLPADPTADRYVQAAAQTFASYLARATIQKQRFDTFDEFSSAACQQTVRTGRTIDDWLPARLLMETAENAKNTDVQWSLKRVASDRGRVQAICPDGVRIVTIYAIQSSQPPKITTDFDDTALVVDRARSLIASGKLEEARKILLQSLQSHPNSPLAEEARKLIRQTR